MSKCSTKFEERDSKASMAASVKEGFCHKITILTGKPFLLMGISPNTSRASWDSEVGESSTRGISTRNLGCFSFLSLPASLGLLIGFDRVVEREILAWRMASSLEVGGVEEEREDLMMDGGRTFALWRGFEGKMERLEW